MIPLGPQRRVRQRREDPLYDARDKQRRPRRGGLNLAFLSSIEFLTPALARNILFRDLRFLAEDGRLLTMLTWSQIKPLIREIVSPVFLQMGFEQPGISMWRHRDKFIDVIEFRVARAYLMQIVFGCEPRLGGKTNPHCWDCAFTAQPSLQFEVDSELLSFGADEERQRENLVRLAGQLSEPAQRWFAYFESVASARLAVEQRYVFIEEPGSPAYLRIVAALKALELR